MKEFSLLRPFMLLCMLTVLYSASFGSEPRKRDLKEPGWLMQNDFPASQFVRYTASDYTRLTGKKMNGWQRISFGILKIKLKRELKKNPELSLSDFYKENKKISAGLVLVIVLLALLLLLVIVLGIGYHGGL